MKLDAALQGITHFFNDIIGAIVPGFVFLAGLVVMYKNLLNQNEFLSIIKYDYFIVILLTISFAIGHVLLSIYKEIIEAGLKKIQGKRIELYFFKLKTPQIINGSAENLNKVQMTRPFALFKSYFESRIENKFHFDTELNVRDWSFHELRNVAMSISSEAASLGQRFMFISLLCNGVGTSLILLWLNFITCILLAPDLLKNYSNTLPITLQLFLLMLTAILLIRRGDEFNSRALSTPFCVASAIFWNKKNETD